jgi:hypothetical protein
MSIHKFSRTVVVIERLGLGLLLLILRFSILCGVWSIRSAQDTSTLVFSSCSVCLFVTMGNDSHENACLLSSMAMQSSLAIKSPCLFALAIACVSSRLTWRLHASRLAQVPGIVSVEYAQPYSPECMLPGSWMWRHLWSSVSSQRGCGSDHVMTDVYIKSRSSRGRPKNSGILRTL